MPPTPPCQLSFLVYVRDADQGAISLSNHVGDVAQMPLADGRCLTIVANADDV